MTSIRRNRPFVVVVAVVDTILVIIRAPDFVGNSTILRSFSTRRWLHHVVPTTTSSSAPYRTFATTCASAAADLVPITTFLDGTWGTGYIWYRGRTITPSLMSTIAAPNTNTTCPTSGRTMITVITTTTMMVATTTIMIVFIVIIVSRDRCAAATTPSIMILHHHIR